VEGGNLMTTIGIVTTVWGENYTRFIPKWWEAVATLERQPDEVTFVTDSINEEAIRSNTPSHLVAALNIVVVPNPKQLLFNDFWDKAYRSCNQKWMATCCIDDVFLPKALSAIDDADADEAELVIDGCIMAPHNSIWTGYWNPEQIFDIITLPGNAPMTKDLYERVGGFDRDIYWSDWAFYMKAAKAGVKVYQTDILRIVFDVGNDRQTRSGVSLDSQTRHWADNQIRNYAAELRAKS
jgi:esterase/lipase superfamily enzyme